MGQAADVMMMSGVRNDQACRRQEQDHSGMVVQDHAAHETP